MLNLLLAIIAATFERVMTNADRFMFRERVIEITNMQRSVGRWLRADSNPVRLMFSATELGLDEINKLEGDQVEDISESLTSIRTKIKNCDEVIDQMKSDIDPDDDSTELSAGPSGSSPLGKSDKQPFDKNIQILLNDVKSGVDALKAEIKLSNEKKKEAHNYQKK